MPAPPFHHLTGAELWRRCDFDRLRIEPSTQSVRLASLEAVDGAAAGGAAGGAGAPGAGLPEAAFEALRERLGGAVTVGCRPDLCTPGVALLADPQAGALFALRDGVWTRLGAEPEAEAEAEPPGLFRPRGAAPGRPFEPAALQRDPYGRLWLWERAANRLVVLDDGSLHGLAEIAPPPGVTIGALAVWRGGVLIADAAAPGLWQRRPTGDWQALSLEPLRVPGGPADPLAGFRPVAGSGHPEGAAYLLFRPLAGGRSRLVVLDAAGLSGVEVGDLEDPLQLLALADGLLLGEAGPEPGHAGLHLFVEYAREESGAGLAQRAVWAVRGFDGRALFADHEGALLATTARGARRLFERAPALAPEGLLETYALDSGQYGCAWHRVFLDLCLPRNTEVTLFARTSDELPPEALRRDARPPLDRLPAAAAAAPEPRAVTEAWAALPLGSRSPDDWEQWQPLGLLDRRAAYADRPFHDAGRALPSDDPLPRAEPPRDLPLETFEGLIKNPKGRYLWLRVRFSGHGTASPALKAARVTYLRPSLLNRLPAYWRADAEAAAVAERALALFEGFDGELNQRVDAIPTLLDPANCPAEALDWLAGFLGLVYDTRLPERVRRQLLLETAQLYRLRGTLQAIERLCAILAEAPVVVMEGFRLRRNGGLELGDRRLHPDGAPLGVLGAAVRLGAAGEGEPGEEDWERALRLSFGDLQARRAAERERGETPCPRRDPEPPLDDRQPIPLYRRFAHRFTVVVMGGCRERLEAILDTAVEINKPAHTLHRFCWLDSGFRLGTTTYVGLGTRFGAGESFAPGLLGSAELGGRHRIGRAAPARPAPGFFVGKTTLAGAGGLGCPAADDSDPSRKGGNPWQ